MEAFELEQVPSVTLTEATLGGGKGGAAGGDSGGWGGGGGRAAAPPLERRATRSSEAAKPCSRSEHTRRREASLSAHL